MEDPRRAHETSGTEPHEHKKSLTRQGLDKRTDDAQHPWSLPARPRAPQGAQEASSKDGRTRQLDAHPSRAFAKRKWSLAKRNISLPAVPRRCWLLWRRTHTRWLVYMDRRHTNVTVSRVARSPVGYPAGL